MASAIGGSCQEMAGGSRRVLTPLFSEDGRFRPHALPVEELMIAGPGVDLGIANPAFEIAGTPVLMFLAGGGVIHPAARAGEPFGRPDAVGHLARSA